MKKLFVLILPFLLSCSSGKQITRNDLIFKGPISSNQNPKLVSNDMRKSSDSLNFKIVRGKYISGSRHVEIIQDENTKLYYWKQFYPNGKLKEEGKMTKNNRIYVEKWKYYSENGQLDSIIDYDKKLKIPYFKALQIAKGNGYEMPMEVDLVKNEGKLSWEFTKWKSENRSGKGDLFFVDTEKGKFTKSNEELIRKF